MPSRLCQAQNELARSVKKTGGLERSDRIRR